MEIIGYPERAITRDRFSAPLIVDEMERALKDGIEPAKLNAMKSKALESVTDYIPVLLGVRTQGKG
jgi:hypothetical protein